MSRFDEVMARVREDADGPIKDLNHRSEKYEPVKTTREILDKTIEAVDGLRSVTLSLSVAQDVHLALHFIAAPEEVFASTELFYELCKARSHHLEKVESTSIAELEAWALTDLPDLLKKHEKLIDGDI